jgi:hypothetical protein
MVPTSRGVAAGVDDDHDAAIALGPPRAHHEIVGSRAARGGAPVDGAHIVAAHVLAQRVELGTLAAHHHARAPLELAQASEPRRQMAAAVERWQHRDGALSAERGLPGREAQRTEAAHRHVLAAPHAAAERLQLLEQAPPLAGWHDDPLPQRQRAHGRLPAVAHDRPQRTRAVVDQGQLVLDGLAQPGAARAVAQHAHRAR